MSVEMLTTAAYIVAALMFIMSLAGLSKHETSRGGLAFGIVGMVLALVATIASLVLNLLGKPQVLIGLGLLVVVILIGAGIGLWRARVVQ